MTFKERLDNLLEAYEQELTLTLGERLDFLLARLEQEGDDVARSSLKAEVEEALHRYDF